MGYLTGIANKIRPKKIRSQLILGIVSVHLLLMGVFVYDMTARQRVFLRGQHLEQSMSMASEFALNSKNYIILHDLDGLERLTLAQGSFPNLRYAMVLSPDKDVLTHTNASYTDTRPNDKISLGLKDIPRAQVLLDDNSMLDIASPVLQDGKIIGWARVGMDQGYISENLAGIVRNGILYMCVALVIGFFVAVSVANRLNRGLYSLIRTTDKIKEGDHQLRVAPFRGFEISKLGTAINQMLDKIDVREKRIIERESQLTTLFESIEGAASLLDTEKKYLLFNKRFIYEHRLLTGQDPHVGQEVYDLFPEEIKESRLKALDNVLKGDKEIVEADYLRDGLRVYYRTSFNPVVTNGKVTGISTYSIDLSKSKEAEFRIKERESQLTALFNTIEGSVALYDANKELVLFNGHFAHNYKLLTNHDAEVGHGAHHFLSEEAKREPSEMMDSALKGNKEVFEKNYLADGKMVYFRTSFNPVINDGKVIGFTSFSLDLTKAREDEIRVKQSEEKFRMSFMTSQDAFYIGTLEEGRIIDVNEGFYNLFGHTREESIGKTSTELGLYVHPEQREKMVAELKTNGYVKDLELTGRKRNAELMIISVNVNLWEMNSEQVIMAVIRDITESKRVEKELIESKNRLGEVLENSLSASYKRNLQTNSYDYLSPVFKKITGFTQEEMNSLPLENVIGVMHPDDVQMVRDKISMGISKPNGFANSLEYRFKHKTEGGYRWLRDDFVVMHDEHGQAISFIGSVSDITEQKESELQFRDLVEKSLIGVYIIQKGKYVYVNPKLAQTLGYTQEEMLNIEDLTKTVVDENYKPDVLMEWRKKVEAGIIDDFHIELKYKRKDGESIWAEAYCGETLYKGAKAIIGTLQDITERRRADTLIKEQAETFSAIIENANESIWLLSPDLKVLQFNKTAKDRMRLNRGKGARPGADFREFLHAGSENIFMAMFNDAMAGKYPEQESQQTNIRGDIFWLRTRMYPVYDTQKRLIGITVLAENISERKKATELFRYQFENSPDIILFVNRDLAIGSINRAIPGGPSVKGLIGLNCIDVLPEASRMSVKGAVLKCFATGQNQEIENLIRGDRWVSSRFVPIATDGVVHQIMIIATDITEKRAALQKLRDSEERHRSLIENIGDAIILLDADGNTTYRSPSAQNVTGFATGELEGKTVFDTVHPDDRKKFKGAYSRAVANGGFSAHGQYRVSHKGGGHVWVEGTIKNMLDDKAIHAIVINYRDISERKKLEEQQLLMSSIVNSSDDAIISKTLDGIITSWNKGAEKVLGYSAEEAIGKHISIIIPTELHNEEDHFLARIHEGLSIDHYETRRIRKDKVMIYASLTISPIMNSLGKVVGASKILRDITERKIAEEKIKKSEADYRQLFDLSPAPMWVIDNRTHKFIRTNKACVNNYGYDEEEFKGMTLEDISLGGAETYVDNIPVKKAKKNLRSIYSYRHRKRSGEQIDVVTSSIPVVLNGKSQLMMIAVDVTEKSLYEKNLTRAAINAQEDERYEIGAELHDNVCQILAASMMFLGLIKKSLSADANDLFNQTYQYITLASDEIRNLSHRLAPVFVEDSNLENAFDRLLQDFNIEKKYTVNLDFDEATKVRYLNRDLQLNLYRILQEQLRNILKYAEATTIDVTVNINNAVLRMRIADNGVGFNVKDKKGGIGLANINRRTQMHSGKFSINSAVGKGCEVLVEIPLSINAN